MDLTTASTHSSEESPHHHHHLKHFSPDALIEMKNPNYNFNIPTQTPALLRYGVFHGQRTFTTDPMRSNDPASVQLFFLTQRGGVWPNVRTTWPGSH